MSDLKVETGKFAVQAEAAAREAKARFDAEEVKASSWIARHPRWTLAIGVALLIANLYQALRHL